MEDLSLPELLSRQRRQAAAPASTEPTIGIGIDQILRNYRSAKHELVWHCAEIAATT